MQQNLANDVFTNELLMAGNISLVLALAQIVSDVYGMFPAVPLTIAQYASTRESNWYHRDLMEEMLKRVARRHYRVMMLESNLLYEPSRTNEVYDYTITALFFIDSWESYTELEADLLNPQSYYKRTGYYSIIYTGQEPQLFDTIQRIFTRLFELYILNVNVVMLLGNGTTSVYTYFPFQPGICNRTSPRMHITFAGIERRHNFTIATLEYFPNKVRNMYGCELVVMTWHNPPFTLLERNNEDGKVSHIHGIEGMLVNYLAGAMNFTMRIVENKMGDRGAMLQTIIDGEANVSLCSFLYDWSRSLVMMPTYPYLYKQLVFGTPRGRPLTPYERLIRPFRYNTWSCLGASISLGALLICALKLLRRSRIAAFVYGARTRFPISNLWNTLYGGAIYGELPRRNFARYLLTLWLIYTLVLRAAYTGQMFLQMQDSHALITLRSLRQIATDNYTVYTSPQHAAIIRDVTGSPTLPIRPESMANFHEILRNISRNEHAVLATVEFVLKIYNHLQPTVNTQVRLLPEQFGSLLITMYLRKDSYLGRYFDQLISQFMAAGLMDHEDLHYMELYKRVKTAPKEPIVLSLSMLIGIFSIYVFLLCCCLVVFLLELAARKLSLVKSLIDFFNY